jgi:outer membrane receptor for ferric coprogen and ferric-rhodotorulic acid
LLLLAALAGVFSGGISHAQNVPSQEPSGGVSQSVQNPDSPSASPSASASSPEEPTLPTVTVSGQSERETLTEFTGSYTTGATNTTTKLPLTLRETPQSITVITRQQMDDFGLNSVNEVLENTSSVYVNKIGLTARHYSRGFQLQHQFDGNPSTGVGDFRTSPDSAFLDHVEIQQGAAGLLTGAGEPGGTINMVRKRPTESFQAQVEAGFGSWDRKRLVGDISGPLTPSGVLRGRAVVVSDESNSFIDYVFDNRKAFYGVLEVVPNAETKIGLGLQYQKNKYRWQFGTPVDPSDGHSLFSRSVFFGEPDRNSEEETLNASLYLERKLSNDWMFKASYVHDKSESDLFAGLMWEKDMATGYGEMRRYRTTSKGGTDSVDIYANGPAQLFGRRHELAFGANGSERQSRSATDFDQPVDPVNIYDAYHPSVLPTYEKRPIDYGDPDKTRQYGIWGVARLNLTDSLKLILGTRVSWYGYWNGSGVQTMEENGVVSPYGGLVYDLNKQLSVYASYSDIFKPQTNLDRTGNVLEPVVGANYEAGIKGEFFNKRLNAAAAIFRLEQTNLAKEDEDFGRPNGVCPSWCYIAQGKIISEGVDVSVNGALSSHWNVGAGYTYSKSEYATGSQKGDRYNSWNPVHAFRLSTTYRIPGSGWLVGGNLRAQGRTYNGVIKQGSYTLLGLMAKYQINPQAEISITANNVLDQEYRYPNNDQGVHYGEPRRLELTAKYFF